MIKKLHILNTFLFIFLLTSCSNFIGARVTDFGFSIGEGLANEINKTVSAVSDDSEFVVTSSFQGLELQSKSITVQKKSLKTVEFQFENIPFNREFKVLLDVSFNGHVIYEGISNPIVLNGSNNGTTVNIEIKPRKGKITYESNGGKDETGNEPVYNVTEYFISDKISANNLPKLTKPGYKWGGWYFDKACQNPVTDFGQNNYLGDITLYSAWIPDCSIMISASDAYLDSYEITGALLKDGKNIKSFTISPITNKSVAIEKLEPGNYTVDLTGTNKKEKYTCDAFTLTNEKNKEIKINVAPNNYYFIKYGAAAGGNGTELKPYNNFPVTQEGGKTTTDTSHEMFSHDSTISIDGSFSVYKLNFTHNNTFVKSKNASKASIMVTSSGKVSVGSNTDICQLIINDVELSGGKFNGAEGFVEVYKDSKLILENNASVSSVGDNSICLLTETSQLELNNTGKIDRSVYFSGNTASGNIGRITVKGNVPKSQITLSNVNDGLKVLSDESLKTFEICRQFKISDNLIVDGTGKVTQYKSVSQAVTEINSLASGKELCLGVNVSSSGEFSSLKTALSSCSGNVGLRIKYNGALPEDALRNCTKLTAVELCTGITELGNWAFAGCSALKIVILSEGLTTLKIGAFEGIGWETVILPSTVTVVEESALRHGPNLIKADLSKCTGLTELGMKTFSNSPNLEEVLLHNNTTKIGNGTFNGCTKLINNHFNTIKTMLTDRGYTVDDANNGGCVVSSTKELAMCLVSGKRINIPAGTTTIGKYSLADVTADVLYFPTSVNKINTQYDRECNIPGFEFEDLASKWTGNSPYPGWPTATVTPTNDNIKNREAFDKGGNDYKWVKG